MVGKSEVDVIVTEDFVIGMPQLALGGLSENWLLKECGNQHWIALAKCLGLPTPDFINQQGQKMYAAFLVVKITQGAFEKVYENSTLTINTQLQRVSSSRSYSHHEIHVEGECCGQVELLSSFVNRTEQGNNQSVARGEVFSGEWSACEASTLMMKAHKAGRMAHAEDAANSHDSLANIKANDKEPLYSYKPCPYSDFNGADFLYFAQFQSVMDRAERHFQMKLTEQKDSRLWRTLERTICYYGNINLDDALLVSLQTQDIDKTTDEIRHHGRMYRLSDHKPIANIATQKAYMEHPLSSFQANHGDAIKKGENQ
ncbi:hypothetical protein MUS1_05750 [Marinomonas ushuaiensis DSM 15871]|uniref:Uncharacterized protein n=1 Tax=Marinomonas ushuaiensis DSM 15871 TaxID=1122207 RepID=X7E1J6_9GAMM|nr:Pnap_2097 family protein [Marinomonas ushuaiensis]ETX09837.1 hypothetical protein MUS1_05750 [Marinomonas ushuaiensis DSM 15871]